MPTWFWHTLLSRSRLPSPALPTPRIYAYNRPVQLHYIQLYNKATSLWHNVRPTSQRRAVSPAALFSAAPDCRWRRRRLSRFFRTTTYFYKHFPSLIYNVDNCALHDLSADSTMKSPLLCDTAYLSVSWMESLCDLFHPIVQSQATEEHDSWQHAFSDIDHLSMVFAVLVVWCSHCCPSSWACPGQGTAVFTNCFHKLGGSQWTDQYSQHAGGLLINYLNQRCPWVSVWAFVCRSVVF